MEDHQPAGTEERISKGDEMKYNIFGYKATANEVHAALLGLIGVFGGLAYGSGMTTEALGASALLIGLAFGTKKLPDQAQSGEVTIAVETKRHEPWWFTTPYILTFIIGILIDGVV